MILCSYGCGRVAIKQFKNGVWCCSKDRQCCPEMKRKNGDLKRGRTKENNEGVKRAAEKISKMMKGRTKESYEYIRKRIEKTSKMMTGRTKETHPGVRKAAEKLTGRTKENDKGRRSQAEKLKEKWKDPEFQRKQKEACHTTPNRPETKILNLLNDLYPNEWKYTGNKSFFINGKNPDFTCINGKKLIIEHFGTYYHKGDDPEDRKKTFAEFGYNTLVIWESELKNIKQVEEKIRNFIEF